MGLFNLICCGSGQPLSPSHSSHQLAQGIDIKSTPPRERESEYDELIKVKRQNKHLLARQGFVVLWPVMPSELSDFESILDEVVGDTVFSYRVFSLYNKQHI